jgi:phage terminase large subunit-like protein
MLFSYDDYVSDVLSGRVLACKWVRLACERHKRDIEESHETGFYFDHKAAKIAIAFFKYLKHWKGEWNGQAIELSDWQQFIVGSLFGWKRPDGFRRFRTAYIEVPRKAGKTTMAAGIGLYLMLADGEAGAEIYSAATKKDQAKISHNDAKMMLERSPQLSKLAKIYRDNLSSIELASKFEPLGRDADSLDGLNIHGAICDEVHAWPHRDLWDVLQTATGSRRQPLMLAITTAGFNRQSFCWNMHDYSTKILEKIHKDDSFFGIIYTLDDGDDWENPETWAKANPNLGISKKLDDIQRLANQAKLMPEALNSFLRLHLNVWTQAETSWVNGEKWAECGIVKYTEDSLKGRVCFAGLDLSTTTDISALVYVFPPLRGEKGYKVIPRFFIPANNIRERVKRDRVPYDMWLKQGLVIATPGDVIDYDFIIEHVKKDGKVFKIKEIAFDRWGAVSISTQLSGAGFQMVQFGQGFASMSAPMKELEKIMLTGELQHNDNPVLSWMAHNVVARIDPAGNIKPDKEASTEKIDGIVSLIMGLDRAMRAGNASSVYQSRGVLTL